MSKNKKKGKGTTSRWILISVLVVLAGVIYFLSSLECLVQVMRHTFRLTKMTILTLYMPKLQPLSTPQGFWVFKQIAGVMGYAKKIRPGRFVVGSSGSLQTSRHIINGLQAPVKVTIRSVRTIDDLATDVSEKLMKQNTCVIR